MKIYTKGGDKGTTALFGGSRVSKADVRIEAYGTLDELNSVLGYLADQLSDVETQKLLRRVQVDLFTIGSHLAADSSKKNLWLPDISNLKTNFLEQAIDKMEEDLPPLKNFILPGGHPLVSLAHVCRTICRRAERNVVRLNNETKVPAIFLEYLNRLSDYFFVLARYVAITKKVTELPWKPRE